MTFPDYKREQPCLSSGYDFVAGCDEVGVGPLAGPVVAAAVILDPHSIGKYRSKSKWYRRVRDSKTVNEEEREILALAIKEHSIAWGTGIVWQDKIDEMNIHHASLLAMRIAVEELLSKVTGKVMLYVDGRFKVPGLSIDQESIVGGDNSTLTISAASIIAKTIRDGIMRDMDKQFPGYDFKKHKGYNTKTHQEALARLGACALHRRSFIG